MPPVELFLFGAPRLERAGETITLHRTRGLGLLAYLAITRQPQTREALATLLWPDFGPTDARNNLRRELSLLKDAIGDGLLDIQRTHLGLDATALTDNRLWVDVIVFDALMSAVDAHQHHEGQLCSDCVEWFQLATSLYTNDFLAGFNLPYSSAFNEWRHFEGERLRAALDLALSLLSAWHIREGDFRRAVEMSRRRLSLDPLNEPAHRDLMVALARSGQQATVLKQHAAFVALMAEELQQEPEPLTLEMAEAIRRREITSIPAFPQEELLKTSPKRSTTRPRHNLPVQPTPFLGRESELAELTSIVAGTNGRLTSIVGPGGMGKTRLALAWAARYIPEQSTNGDNLYRDGVFFINLAPLTSPQQILSVLAEALGFPVQSSDEDSRSAQQQIIDYLAGKQVLLLLDNFEHMLDATQLVVDIMEAAPGVNVLVTTRERLNLRGEQVYPIQGLTLLDWEIGEDAAENDGVRLFLQSARRLRPDFTLRSNDELHEVARICHLVAGMPLAIELAAAWVDVIAVDAIATELKDGLDLLQSEMRDVPERQRSVRATIDYSWQKLDEAEQRVFAQLSTFRGGFTRDAAEAVTGASLRQLSRLAHKSLLQMDPTTHRYQIHELLRQYGSEKLAAYGKAAQATHDTHARYFASMLVAAESRLLGDNEKAVLDGLNAESDNIDVARRWLLACDDVSPLAEAMNGLCSFLLFRLSIREGWEICDEIVTQFSNPSSLEEKMLLLRALNWLCYFNIEHRARRDLVDSYLNRARILIDELSQSDFDVRNDHAINLYMRADAIYNSPYAKEGIPWVEEALDLFEHTGQVWGISISLRWLVLAYFYSDESYYEVSRKYSDRTIIHISSLKNLRIRSETVAELSTYALQSGDLQLLTQLIVEIEKDLEQFEDLGLHDGAQNLRQSYAWVLIIMGRPQDAVRIYEEVRKIDEEYELKATIFKHFHYGQLLSHDGRYEEAGNQYRAGLALADESRNAWVGALLLVVDGMRRAAMGDLTGAEKVLLDALESNREAKMDVDAAGNIGNLSVVRHRLSQTPADKSLLARSLRAAVNKHAYLPLIEVLPAIALKMTLEEPPRTSRVTELYFLLMNQPYYSNSRVFQDMSGQLLAEVANTQSDETRRIAEGWAQEVDLWVAAGELLDEIVGLGWAEDD